MLFFPRSQPSQLQVIMMVPASVTVLVGPPRPAAPTSSRLDLHQGRIPRSTGYLLRPENTP